MTLIAKTPLLNSWTKPHWNEIICSRTFNISRFIYSFDKCEIHTGSFVKSKNPIVNDLTSILNFSFIRQDSRAFVVTPSPSLNYISVMHSRHFVYNGSFEGVSLKHRFNRFYFHNPFSFPRQDLLQKKKKKRKEKIQHLCLKPATILNRCAERWLNSSFLVD